MTPATDRPHAECEECGKGYRVPDAARTYTCKACGGTVRVAEAPADPLADMVACPVCQAMNPAGSRFCAECGQGVGQVPPTRSDRSLRARRQASGELSRAFKRINVIRWLYVLGAAGYALTALLFVLALQMPEVAPREAGLFIALYTALTAFMVVGAIQIRFQPFVWTVIVASLATLSTGLALLENGLVTFEFFWSLAWATVFWLAVVPTVRFQRLIEQHPDLYIVHRIHGTQHQRALEHRSKEPLEERSRRLLAKAGSRAWKLSGLAAGAIVLASLLGSTTVYAKLRPQDFASAEKLFRSAWNDGDRRTIEELFPPRIRESEATWLAGIVAGNEWTDAWPELDEGTEVATFGERIRIDYLLEEGELVTFWQRNEGRWYLVAFDAPVPPLTAPFERFVDAWKASNTDAIARLFVPKSQSKMKDSIRRAAERRGWEELPAIRDVETGEVYRKRAEIVLQVKGGTVTTRWALQANGNWALDSVKLPRL